MEALFSLKGLITITISSLISVKALRLNVKVSRDINVQGSGNIVVANEALSPIQKSFKLLWQILAFLIGCSYPILGSLYNAVLQSLAFIGVPLAFIAFIVTIRAYGAYRIWDLFYVVGAGIACWLAHSANLYLVNTAANALKIYPMVKSIAAYGFPASYGQWSAWVNFIVSIGAHIVSVIGFAALLLSLLYLVFAYLTERSFDGAIHFTLHYVGMALIGFFMACDGLTALMVHDFGYLRKLIAVTWPF
jgi:hypothetical protein